MCCPIIGDLCSHLSGRKWICGSEETRIHRMLLRSLDCGLNGYIRLEDDMKFVGNFLHLIIVS